MSRRLPNLKQLRAFEAAARYGSFKLAADELHVSQAAISHQIKALEEHFGCRLFNRLNRKVALTEAAASLADQFGEALDQIAEASGKFRSQAMLGTLEISVTPFYANRMILPYIDGFLHAHPGLKVEFDFSYDIADFANSDVDAALRYGLSDRSDAQMRLIHFDRVSPVASPALIGRTTVPMTPTEIAKLPLAAVAGQEHYWDQWFNSAGLSQPPTDWSRHKQRALALDYALAGNAVVLADLPLIRNELQNGSLLRLSNAEVTLDRGIHVAEPLGPFRDPRMIAFGDWLADNVARLGAIM